MAAEKVKPPNGYRFGKMRKFSNYCREIRICVGGVDDGKIFEGVNTNTEEKEMCIVFKADKNNKYNSICYDLIKIT